MNNDKLKQRMSGPRVIDEPVLTVPKPGEIISPTPDPAVSQQKVPRPEGKDSFVSPPQYAYQHFLRRVQEMKDRGGRGKKAQMGELFNLFREGLEVAAMAQVHLDASFVEGVGARLPSLADKACCERLARIMRGDEPIPEKSSIIVPG